MLKIAILDDDSNILTEINNRVKLEFEKKGIIVETFQYSLGRDLINSIYSNNKFCDVIFLDIHLPDMLGTDVAKIVRSVNKNILLVFVTAHDKYVFEAFDYEAISYIRKKEFNSKIESVIIRLIEKCANENEILLKNYKGKYRICLKDIVYLESNNHNISIHNVDNHIINVTDSLRNLENQLSIHNFFRIHASILVNLNYVYAIKQNSAIIKYGNIIEKLPISRYREKEMREAFLRFLRNNL